MSAKCVMPWTESICANYNVVVTSPSLASEAVGLLNRAGCVVHYTAAYPDVAAVADLAARVQADAVLARQGRISEEVMTASSRLRIVARHGTGVDEVDLAAAARHGVVVTNTPGANAGAVAEHTLALILALVKGIAPLGRTVADGGWREAGAQTRDVAGLRLGLLGCGTIGMAVARLANAFGMRVAAFDPGLPRDIPSHIDVVDDSLLLATRSDVISVHCPLVPGTRGLVGPALLSAMPPGGFVVNTARGGIVDEAALVAALDAGHLAGAALDVFETEPPPNTHPLRNHPKVLATPHVAGVTPGSLVAMGVEAAECIAAVLANKAIPRARIVVAGRAVGSQGCEA
jgi:D-3-phosphoglycerate dehydrogenase